MDFLWKEEVKRRYRIPPKDHCTPSSEISLGGGGAFFHQFDGQHMISPNHHTKTLMIDCKVHGRLQEFLKGVGGQGPQKESARIFKMTSNPPPPPDPPLKLRVNTRESGNTASRPKPSNQKHDTTLSET